MKHERLQYFNYAKNVLGLKKWDIYRLDLQRQQTFLLAEFKKKFSLRRLIVVIKLAQIRKMMKIKLHAKYIDNLFKRATVFITMQLYLLCQRNKRRYGSVIEKRIEIKHIHNPMNFIQVSIHYNTQIRAKRIMQAYLYDMH